MPSDRTVNNPLGLVEPPRARGLLVSALALCLAACGSDKRPGGPVSVPDAGDTPVPALDAGHAGPTGRVPVKVCSNDAYCWDSPAVQGNTLNDTFVIAPDDIWAVGDLGTVLHFDGFEWQRQDVPSAKNLRAVWASANAVWAVGEDSTILTRTADGWQSVTPAVLGGEHELNGVWGSWDGKLWVVGADGILLEQSDLTWTSANVESVTRLTSVWGEGNEAWAVGNAGVVMHYSAGTWTRVDAGTTRDLTRVHGQGDDVWLAGAAGEVRRWDGERWQAPPVANGELRPQGELAALWVSLDDKVYTANRAGQVYVWDSKAACPDQDAGASDDGGVPLCPRWNARSSGQDLALHALSGRGTFSVAVGEFGTILTWQGEVRSVWSRGSIDNYLDVSGKGDDVWVGGDRVLKRAGDGWEEIERDGPRAVYALQALGEGVALIAGTGGMARRFSNDTWEMMDVRADAWLRGLWSDGTSGWLVGARGGSWGLLNGRLWTPLETRTTNDLLAVWITPDSRAWAVGKAGTILRHDGIGWATIPSGPDGGVDADLRDVWGSAGDDIWAVGTGGVALRWDGTSWQNTAEPAAFSLNSVWGRGSNDVWAVGSGGTIRHFDGSSWQAQASGTTHALNSVWGNSQRLWIVGEHGTILTKSLE